MKKALLSALLVAAVAIGCKKDSSSSSSIVGKWTFTNQVEWNEPKTGAIQKDTTTYDPTSYVNFLSNGTCYEHDSYMSGNTVKSNYDTSTYTVSGNTLTLIHQGVAGSATIQNLSSNNFTLYNKITNYDGNGGIRELWDNFKR